METLARWTFRDTHIGINTRQVHIVDKCIHQKYISHIFTHTKLYKYIYTLTFIGIDIGIMAQTCTHATPKNIYTNKHPCQYLKSIYNLEIARVYI